MLPKDSPYICKMTSGPPGFPRMESKAPQTCALPTTLPKAPACPSNLFMLGLRDPSTRGEGDKGVSCPTPTWGFFREALRSLTPRNGVSNGPVGWRAGSFSMSLQGLSRDFQNSPRPKLAQPGCMGPAAQDSELEPGGSSRKSSPHPGTNFKLSQLQRDGLDSQNQVTQTGTRSHAHPNHTIPGQRGHRFPWPPDDSQTLHLLPARTEVLADSPQLHIWVCPGSCQWWGLGSSGARTAGDENTKRGQVLGSLEP